MLAKQREGHIAFIRWMGQRNPAPVENGGKHPTIYRFSTILLVVQDFFHPQYISCDAPRGWFETRCAGGLLAPACDLWCITQLRKRLPLDHTVSLPRDQIYLVSCESPATFPSYWLSIDYD